MHNAFNMGSKHPGEGRSGHDICSTILRALCIRLPAPLRYGICVGRINSPNTVITCPRGVDHPGQIDNGQSCEQAQHRQTAAVVAAGKHCCSDYEGEQDS